jgi:hypothetical protein
MNIKKECITTQYNMGHDALSQPLDCLYCYRKPKHLYTMFVFGVRITKIAGLNSMANVVYNRWKFI